MGAAVVVGMGVGEEDGLQLNPLPFGEAEGPPGRVLVQSRVYEQSLPLPDDEPYVGAALDVEDAGGQFCRFHSLSPIR